MYGILKSIGIDFSSHEYIQIIRDCFNSISNTHFDDDDKETETDLNHDNAELVIEELLLLHQQRLVMQRNLPDEYDFVVNTDTMYNEEIPCNFNGRYSFFDINY